MAHKRIVVRDNIAQAILDNCPILEGNVFVGRYYSVNDTELPCCVVNIDNEVGSIGTTMINPRTSERILLIRLGVYVKDNADLGDFLSKISSEIEIALGLDTTLGGYALDIFLVAYDETLNGDQNTSATAKKVAYSETIYQVLYDVPENDPEV